MNRPTTVINMNTARSAVQEAKREGRYVPIDRTTIWGNPFYLGTDGNRDEVIKKFEAYLLGNEVLMRQVWTLRGKVLGCHCAPMRCHGEVLARLADATSVSTASDSGTVSTKIPHEYLSAGDAPGADGDRPFTGCYICGGSRKDHVK
jgi:hypothetical protein